MVISRWSDWALRALFDPTCAACRNPLGPERVGPVCRTCWNAIKVVRQPWCDRCGEPLRSWRHPAGERTTCARCLSQPPQFDSARAYGIYEGSLREIIHALKYRGHQSLGTPLGALMKMSNDGLLAGTDAVVPVPLHPWRYVRRGFNQADELAQALGPPVWRALRRNTLGVPQAGLRADRRQANVRGAYCLSLMRRGGRRRRARRVVLVDDVMTTGATLDACSRALREGGVEWIGALTLARAATSGAPAAAGPPPPQLLALHSGAARR